MVLWRLGALLGLLLLPSLTLAEPVGETHRVTRSPSAAVRDAQHNAELRITIWYPAKPGSHEEPLFMGAPEHPDFEVGSVAADAAIAPDADPRGRAVILLSHGFGATARMVGWFGIAMAKAGYVVISVDHPGNNGRDTMTVPGAILWGERAQDLKLALESVSHDPDLGSHLDVQRVGAAGFSLGGLTALLLGGARPEPARLTRFCRANPEDGICRPQLEFTFTPDQLIETLQDPAVAALEAHASDDRSLPQVKAVFAMAPAVIQGLDPSSLSSMHVPVVIIAGEADTVVTPASNALVAASLIPGARLKMVPGAGHYVFLNTCTKAAAVSVTLCKLAGPQQSTHATAIALAKQLFEHTLRARTH